MAGGHSQAPLWPCSTKLAVPGLYVTVPLRTQQCPSMLTQEGLLGARNSCPESQLVSGHREHVPVPLTGREEETGSSPQPHVQDTPRAWQLGTHGHTSRGRESSGSWRGSTGRRGLTAGVPRASHLHQAPGFTQHSTHTTAPHPQPADHQDKHTDSQCHLCSDTDTGGGRHTDRLRWGRFSTSAAQGPPQCPAARRECATFPTWSLRCPVRRSVLNDLTQGQDRRRGRVSREGRGILSQLDWVNTATWGRWVSGP